MEISQFNFIKKFVIRQLNMMHEHDVNLFRKFHLYTRINLSQQFSWIFHIIVHTWIV